MTYLGYAKRSFEFNSRSTQFTICYGWTVIPEEALQLRRYEHVATAIGGLMRDHPGVKFKVDLALREDFELATILEQAGIK